MTPRIPTIALEPGEARLVAAARGGDTRAFAELLSRHQAVAFRAAFLVTGSAAEAEDATQDAAIKAWLALPRFRPRAPFRPWFVRIAINEARNRRRSAGRRAGLTLRLGGEPSLAASSDTEALALAEGAELAAALERLRESDQLVIAARHLLGLSEAETAAALGVRRGTVKSRLSRALERLRSELGERA